MGGYLPDTGLSTTRFHSIVGNVASHRKGRCVFADELSTSHVYSLADAFSLRNESCNRCSSNPLMGNILPRFVGADSTTTAHWDGIRYAAAKILRNRLRAAVSMRVRLRIMSDCSVGDSGSFPPHLQPENAMSERAPNQESVDLAPVPRTFFEYLKSFGPGLVVVLTWLGAGDIISMGVAGGNYGYSLMWVLVLAIVMRFFFVSLIARYQLCNHHGEGVLDGLVRLHPLYAPVLLLATVVMGHIYGSYMTVGIGEACVEFTGVGEVWHWAVLWNGLALVLVFQPAYTRVEFVFKIFLALLSISFVGTAVWVGPDLEAIFAGLYRMELPEQTGKFSPTLVAVAMIGAVGGSLMNLVYPYFLESKGWRGPQYRRVQLYDFLTAVLVMIVLNLSIWTLGAELLHTQDKTIETIKDLPAMLSEVLGNGGRMLFFLGVFSAVFTSLVGHALGLAYMGSHAWAKWKSKQGSAITDYRAHACYRWIVIWCLVSPLIWTAPGMPDVVTLTLVANSAQVMLLPPIAGGIWRITAARQYIGAEHRNRWWENAVMVFLFALAIYGAVESAEEVVSTMKELLTEVQ